MSLSITSITSPTGCAHRLVVVDQEGVSRERVLSFTEIDDLIDTYPTQLEAMWALVVLWAAYRRKVGRAVSGTIA